MNITAKLFSLAMALMLLSGLALPIFAAPLAVAQNTDYIPQKTGTVGIEGYSITVSADGSFIPSERDGAAPVIFGEQTVEATLIPAAMPYPVTAHTYSIGALLCTVEQFMHDSGRYISVFSRFTVKNTSDVAQSFPTVSGTVAITEEPTDIAPGKSASCDYCLTLAYSGSFYPLYTASALDTHSYDEAMSEMKAFWDGYLSKHLTVSELSEGHASSVLAYKAELVSSAVSGKASSAAAIAAPSLLAEAESWDDLYTAAIGLMRTGNSQKAAAIATGDRAKELLALPAGELPFDTLEECLATLIELQSLASLLKALSVTDSTLSQVAEEAKAAAYSLSETIANAIEDETEDFTCRWEAAGTDKGSSILLESRDFASAKALCDWYAKSTPFTVSVSKSLIALAKSAVEYYQYTDSFEAALLSIMTVREDGTVIIGRGAPFSLLSENSTISLENIPLSSDAAANLLISAKEKEITINLSGPISAPIQIEFPAFAGYLEYASVGFDNESGIITAPEGTSTVTIRLTRKLANIEKDRFATASLEAAIAIAEAKDQESATTVSFREFSEALLDAQRARTATVSKKLECTEALIKSTERLSPMTAGYTLSIPEMHTSLGSVSESELLQKFTLPSSGTVKELFVKGTFAEDVYATVYTVRGDGYNTDELCAEAMGKKADGGMTFDLDFEGKGEKEYILSILSEGKPLTLELCAADADGEFAYTKKSGEITEFFGASLCIELTVSQVDRSDLDTFYSTCLETDISQFTKDSRNALKKAIERARELLCTPSVTKDEYKKVYNDLKDAYDGLDTYASRDKIEETPVISIILIAAVAVLLTGTLISALAARRRMNTDDEEE